MNKKEIGQLLKQKRIQSGFKWDFILTTLQEKYGIQVARSTIYGYENGYGTPDPDVFLALCDLYGMNDVLSEFGYGVHISKSDGIEDIVLFEDEYEPEDWAIIKTFLGHIPTKKSQ